MNYANVLSPGDPLDQSQQGVLGDVGDHSWEGCGPFSLVGPAPIPCGPALRQALTISQPPPLGRTNRFPPRAATRRPGLGSGPGCPKVPLPGAFNEGWYFPGCPWVWRWRGNPRFSHILCCLAQRPHPHISLSLLPSHWAVAGSPSSTHPTDVPQPPAV